MEWVEVPAGEVSPAPRWAHSCVVLNRKCMLVFGGRAGATLFNDVYVFDLETLVWAAQKCQGNLPSKRHSHTATTVSESALVVVGGRFAKNPLQCNECYFLEVGSWHWTRVKKLGGEAPKRRHGHAVVAVSPSHLLLFGGQGRGSTYYNDTFILDVQDADSPRWLPVATRGSPPEKRRAHTLTRVGDHVVVTGGVNDKHVFSDLYLLSTTAWTWSRPALPGDQLPPLYGHTCTPLPESSGRHVVFGGMTGEGSLNTSIHVVDVGAGFSASLHVGNAPQGRVQHSAALLGSLLAVFGGQCGAVALGDLQLLDVSPLATWPPAAPQHPPSRLRDAIAALQRDRAFVRLPGGFVVPAAESASRPTESSRADSATDSSSHTSSNGASGTRATSASGEPRSTAASDSVDGPVSEMQQLLATEQRLLTETLHEEQLLQGRVQQLQVAMDTLNIQWQLVTQQLASLGPALGGVGAAAAQAGGTHPAPLHGGGAPPGAHLSNYGAPQPQAGAVPQRPGPDLSTPPFPSHSAAPGQVPRAFGHGPAGGPLWPPAR